MKAAGRSNKAPAVKGATSWADETLPLGLRKELLARELQGIAGPKAKAGSKPSESPPGLTGRKVEQRSRDRAR